MGTTILCLHGITMNGASMRACLGPLGDALEAAGFALWLPSAPHRMSDEQAEGIARWAAGPYGELGQDARASFCEGVFWSGGDPRTWLDAHTTGDPPRKIYRALDASLDHLRDEAQGREVVGLLGFSEGAGMGAIVTALASRGVGPVPTIRASVLWGGFRPTFDEPALELWPAPSGPAVLVGVGEEDPLFRGGAQGQAELAEAFAAARPTVRAVPGLGHLLPHDDATVAAIVEHFVAGT